MLKNVSFSYDAPVLENISINSDDGITAIAGKSGCGKTTLLRILSGLITPDSGDVTHSGRVGMVFQEPRLFPWFTVERNLKSVMKQQKLSKNETDERIGKVLEIVGLGDCRKKYPSELSGGMKMRVSIARSLVYECDMLLMDEPFNGLDIPSKAAISELLRKLSADGLKILFVSHIPEDIIEVADRIYILSPRPAKIIDYFSNPLVLKKGYERRERTELINRIRKGLGGSTV